MQPVFIMETEPSDWYFMCTIKEGTSALMDYPFDFISAINKYIWLYYNL